MLFFMTTKAANWMTRPWIRQKWCASLSSENILWSAWQLGHNFKDQVTALLVMNVCVDWARFSVHSGALGLFTWSYLRWPPAAAWVWVHPWSPLQCSRSACRPFAGGSCTTPWTSAQQHRNRTQTVIIQSRSKNAFSFYDNKLVWTENERKWNWMDRKGGRGVALIGQEVAQEKGRRLMLQYNTNTLEITTTIDI